MPHPGSPQLRQRSDELVRSFPASGQGSQTSTAAAASSGALEAMRSAVTSTAAGLPWRVTITASPLSAVRMHAASSALA